MKKTALILALLMSTVMLTACGSKYIAVTKDYTIYIGTKKPVINPENDSVSFEDDTGKTHTIPREDLKQVRPLP
ncbi:YgdI/YgdR family lipoprotein [Desulfovibrio desulfuricans]|uniref:YgdI/YgdR family lipoprotein n=1 Tax=Desulfovibrio desulfuricans TaxID=876 RepID=UPI0035B28C89